LRDDCVAIALRLRGQYAVTALSLQQTHGLFLVCWTLDHPSG